MIRLLLLIAFIVYCNGKNHNLTPLTTFNPNDVIASQIGQYHQDPEILDFISSIPIDDLLLSNGSYFTNDSCAKSIEILARDVYSKTKYALTSEWYY